MKQIIIISAPPNSGKDVAANYIGDIHNATHLRFKDQLYSYAAKFAGITFDTMYCVANDRSLKEVPCTMFRIVDEYVSPRQWLIHCSENIIKPLVGKSFFGECVAKTVRTTDNFRFVISDGGFIEELLPLLDEFDVKIVHLIRNGCSFAGDSRTWLTPVNGYDVIYNNGSVSELYEKLDELSWRFYK